LASEWVIVATLHRQFIGDIVPGFAVARHTRDFLILDQRVRSCRIRVVSKARVPIVRRWPPYRTIASETWEGQGSIQRAADRPPRELPDLRRNVRVYPTCAVCLNVVD